ncbi:MAG: hypothetical protein LBI71_00100 [Enterobacteriaceae bacterium]|jgi:hypothetical protein|nr:hypothetical protein [Enterobacteriaceae bacterium]
MSEVTMSNNKPCSFDPKDFTVQVDIKPSYTIKNDAATPYRTFPGAMVQLYKDQPVTRTSWPAGTYLQPVLKEGKLFSVQQKDKDNQFVNAFWFATVEDVLACDWIPHGLLYCGIFSGTGIPGKDQQSWGYLSGKGNLAPGEKRFGSLSGLTSVPNALTNSTFIINVLQLTFTRDITTTNLGTLVFEISFSQNDLSLAKVLISKHFYITLGETRYYLGVGNSIISNDNQTATVSYSQFDAQKAGAVLEKYSQLVLGPFGLEQIIVHCALFWSDQ